MVEVALQAANSAYVGEDGSIEWHFVDKMMLKTLNVPFIQFFFVLKFQDIFTILTSEPDLVHRFFVDPRIDIWITCAGGVVKEDQKVLLEAKGVYRLEEQKLFQVLIHKSWLLAFVVWCVF